jgi:deoxycytidylate deaminase
VTVTRVPRPELMFALVAPVGVDLDMIIEVITTELTCQKYGASLVKVTTIMQDVPSSISIVPEPYLESIKSRIDYADDLCSQLKRQDALAAIAISAIQSEREKLNIERAAAEWRTLEADFLQEPVAGHAYIIRQFKTPAETSLMRQVYGKLFFQISAYSSPDDRETMLRKKIRESHYGTMDESTARTQAIELMAIDYSESDKEFGQKIRETFPMGDVFVDGVNRANCEFMIKRFIDVIFGDNSITPDHDEYGMYTAKSASFRSCDLSRQVGAAIFRPTGEVASLGCNEVPKYGGGTYWCGDDPDGRDFALGEDQNDRIKREILYQIIEILSKRKGLAEDLEKFGNPKEIMEQLLSERPGIKDSKLMDLLEFGRVIHAEMSAISDAARLGLPTKDATLYSTAFPCHMCAKHIVAAGIERVVFLEPYPKSYAKELHADSIEIEGSKDVKKVKFVPFMGIAPFRYRDFFEKGRRKDSSGKTVRWKDGVGIPIVEIYRPVYTQLETLVSSELQTDLAAAAAKSAAGEPAMGGEA